MSEIKMESDRVFDFCVDRADKSQTHILSLYKQKKIQNIDTLLLMLIWDDLRKMNNGV